jgi:hypothetical protein
MKTFNIFVVAWDGQLNSKLFEVKAIDAELARAAASDAIPQLWPRATETTMIMAEHKLNLDMLEPSMN